MMKYFKNINNLDELRKQYRDLLKLYHPDNANGSTGITQQINAEYDQLFKILKNRHETHSADDNQNSTDFNNMKYDFTEDQILREMLQQIIHMHNVTIEVVGAWLWISGNTYQYKKELKSLGFKWASQKKMWYWHSEAFRKKSHKSLSMDDIRNYYGSTEVQTRQRLLLNQA